MQHSCQTLSHRPGGKENWLAGIQLVIKRTLVHSEHQVFFGCKIVVCIAKCDAALSSNCSHCCGLVALLLKHRYGSSQNKFLRAFALPYVHKCSSPDKR